MWFLMASEWMSAAQCKDAGITLEVFPDDGFMAAVGEKAAYLASCRRNLWPRQSDSSSTPGNASV